MTKPRSKPAPEPTPKSSFQFGDSNDDGVSQTWIRRAVDAGIRLTRTISERSGLKVLPELDLDESGVRSSAERTKAPAPAAPKLPAQPVAVAEEAEEYEAPEGGQFADSENSFGKTAINAFVVNEQAKPQRALLQQSHVRDLGPGIQVRTRPHYHVPIVARTQRTPLVVRIAKAVALLLVLVGLGYGGFRVLQRSKLGEAMLKLGDKPEKGERIEKVDKAEKAEKAEKPDKPDKPEKAREKPRGR